MATEASSLALVETGYVTTGIEAAEDDSIKAIWNQVTATVIQLAGGDQTKIKDGLSIEDVLDCLEKIQQSDKKAVEKHALIRNAFGNTLKCIQTVGGIVASGAGQVSVEFLKM